MSDGLSIRRRARQEQTLRRTTLAVSVFVLLAGGVATAIWWKTRTGGSPTTTRIPTSAVPAIAVDTLKRNMLGGNVVYAEHLPVRGELGVTSNDHHQELLRRADEINGVKNPRSGTRTTPILVNGAYLVVFEHGPARERWLFIMREDGGIALCGPTATPDWTEDVRSIVR